jgi:hypothetical protein
MTIKPLYSQLTSKIKEKFPQKMSNKINHSANRFSVKTGVSNFSPQKIFKKPCVRTNFCYQITCKFGRPGGCAIRTFGRYSFWSIWNLKEKMEFKVK